MKEPFHAVSQDMRLRQKQVFAELANITKLAELKDWQKAKLIEESRHIAGEELSAADLDEVHHWAHRLINQILDGLWPRNKAFHRATLARRVLDNAIIDVRKFQKKLPKPFSLVVFHDSTTVAYNYGSSASDVLKRRAFISLWNIITEPPFPFRSCPVCRTVFVVAGKKIFCSPRCTALSLGPRTDYMKNYMAQRRTEKAIAALKKESPKDPRIKELQAKLARLREARRQETQEARR